MSSLDTIKQTLAGEDKAAKRALFSFEVADDEDLILFKFNLWARYCFPQYFTSPDAPFHKEIDLYNLRVYTGKLVSFVDIAFRGAAKTARTKLFFGFCLANDLKRHRKYIRVLSEDGTNSVQIVTDVYNMMVAPKVFDLYPDLFQKTTAKREETMGSFTTATGVKLTSGIVGSDQRGAIQEEAKLDLLWFEDFENRKTLRSAKKTIAIWENMEEARTSLAINGGSIYTCNYISEQGNVHKLVGHKAHARKLLITPIKNKEGEPTWSRYTKAVISQMKEDDEDFEGERMCEPSASKDILYDRETLDNMHSLQPIKDSAGFLIFKSFDPSHRYAGGADVAGGVGLDSSASVFIDFDTLPAQVVGTFANNLIKPETFGDELNREGDIFGGCLLAPERNYGTEAILRLKQLEANIFTGQTKDSKIVPNAPVEYGWHTNALTKPKMLFALGKAIADGLLLLNDPRLIAEAKAYTRNDLLETVKDPRLTTRHFDLLMACAIAWQMKDYASVAQDREKSYNASVDEYIGTLKGENQKGVWSDDHFDKYFN